MYSLLLKLSYNVIFEIIAWRAGKFNVHCLHGHRRNANNKHILCMQGRAASSMFNCIPGIPNEEYTHWTELEGPNMVWKVRFYELDFLKHDHLLKWHCKFKETCEWTWWSWCHFLLHKVNCLTKPIWKNLSNGKAFKIDRASFFGPGKLYIFS